MMDINPGPLNRPVFATGGPIIHLPVVLPLNKVILKVFNNLCSNGRTAAGIHQSEQTQPKCESITPQQLDCGGTRGTREGSGWWLFTNKYGSISAF